MRVLSTNILATHPSYPKILTAYNEFLKRDGKVNNKKFWETVIVPEIPHYSMQSWYQFLRRFRTEAGLVAVSANNSPLPSSQAAEMSLAGTLLSNNEAVTKAISMALNISVEALQDLMANPTSMSAEKRVELFLKVMKAQDSRVKAIGAIRADNREQERFDHAMDSAAFA